ncbi:MAG: YggS family pyridoxal phosphate-dependent enzyme [Bacteroidota bacterium]|nr:YggS family pyridoxal phosphate-dependent enzyme [Bacteroidota bacterium]
MVAENIQNIKENIEKTCLSIGRESAKVKLIAVSKTFPAEKISEALVSGTIDFGENYVQELVDKRNLLLAKNIRWHFIGHLQSNKVKYIADWVYLIHSVDSESLAEEIQKRAEKANRIIDILVEVNTSEEATKFGVKPAKAIELLKNVSQFRNINLKGLMTIGPFTEDKNASRESFRLLKSIFNEANNTILTKKPMDELSMGMTHDYKIAIAEGSTMVRIGTAIFGSRITNIN